ncbi:serine/threonine protein kinase, partial [Streptomyces sp. NPDC058757]
MAGAGGGGARDAGFPAGRPSGLAGKEIAGYRVEAEIGRGGMAVVYRARDLRLDRT